MPKASTQLVGQSPAFRKALDVAAVAAVQDAPVLIHGETGSGKGVFAEYIHRKSARTGRLVSLNCASFQQNLFESELFGYMKGAFTGAAKDTPGLFEAAEGGTLFLDEIGDTPPEIQPRLLRALEEGVVRRVGGTREIDVDVRLVFATNRDLKELIAAGKFREDLYYRINSFVVPVPPLRERMDDLRELALFFLEEASGDRPHTLAVEAIDALTGYAWPGNIRELRSAMGYAAAQAGDRGTITLDDLPESLRGAAPATPATDDDAHTAAFAELYRAGAENPRLWADFLLKLHAHLGNIRFARGDMLACLRAVRGEEPTNNSLVNEWTRHIKPVPLRFGLVHEEGKKVRIDLAACERALAGSFEPVDDNDAETEIRTETQPALQHRARHTNIPAARTTFVGRKQEHAQLVELVLAGKPNLITLTGPGGTGKTRLARETGRSLTGALPGGTWFADLTESRNIEGVAYAVAHALGVPLTGNQSPELAVGAILRERPPCLLILDNFEQVVEVAGAVISDWSEHAPQVRFLVTSRALLGIEGEREFELQALETPDENAPMEAIGRADAVRLFVDRARVHHVGFALDEKSSPTVAKICNRLEGMPLAIELAAARTTIMQPEQIAERMDRKFAMLKSSRRDLSPRQQSLEATIDWSYDLLDDAERWVFAQMSVFRGGFFLEAAETILDLSRHPEAPPVIDLVQGLREKSLLRALETPFETRFAMYQVIQEYAAARWLELANDAEREAVQQRFADYFTDYAAHWDSRSYTTDAVEALDRLDLARNNIGAVMEACAARNDVERFTRLTLNMYTLLRVRGPARQRVPALQSALRAHGDIETPDRARLQFLLSQTERETGDPVKAREDGEEAVRVAERLGDEGLIATAKFNFAGMEYGAGNVARAQALHREVLPVFRKLGNRLNEARVLSRMALAGATLNEFDEAVENSRKSEEILRELGDLPGIAFVLSTRGTIYNRQGLQEEGLKYIEQSERISRELDDKRMITLCLGNRALINRQLRRFEPAEKLILDCSELARELGDRVTLAKNLMNAGIMYNELARYDDARRVSREASDLFAAQQHPHLQAVCVENIAFAAGKQGDLDGALARFKEALALLGDGAPEVAAGIRTAMAETLLDHDRTAESAELARECVGYWRAHGRPDNRDYFRALTALALAGSDAEAAREALELAPRLHILDSDPSPLARESLRKLKNISGATTRT
ncbi:MAG: sigma 54-interacting transcriptional regulator [Planctomycetes bacterium]|nr:sigma 54-interacting transcriptional regulator [Planctomycetota bacterium]